MTATDFVMLVFVCIIFFQWSHALSLLNLKKQIKVWLNATLSIFGMLFLLVFFVGLYLVYTYAKTDLEAKLGFIILVATSAAYNLTVTILYIVKNKENIDNKMGFLIFTSLIATVSWGLILGGVIKNYEIGDTNIEYLGLMTFNSDTSIFETMVTTIMFFIIILITGYIILLSVIEEAFRNTNSDIYEKITLTLQNGWTRKSFLFVATIGVFFSFFYFAEIDTSTFSEYNLDVFNQMINVFHLIASSLFIPLLLSFILPKQH